jgi:alpha-galactosidase
VTNIAFLGAGSTIFARNVLGDCLHVPSLRDAHIRLIDIDPERLHVSQVMLENINRTLGANARIDAYLADDAATALAGADFVINAIQVGGYEPSTVIDFEIPKKYGLRQTIGDTLGIGGIFRACAPSP